MQKYYCDCCGQEIQRPRTLKVMKHIQDIFETGESERKDNNGDYISHNQLSFEICQKCYNLIMLKAYEEFRTIYNKIEKDKILQKGE